MRTIPTSGESSIIYISYNKCKRRDEILETLFEVVHFKTFLDSSKTKLEILEIVSNPHYVKSVQIRSNFWSVFSYIPTEYGEIRSISVFREIQVVIEYHSRRCFDIFSGNKMIP